MPNTTTRRNLLTGAAVAAAGALTPGRAYNVSGTTETFGVMTTRAVQAVLGQ